MNKFYIYDTRFYNGKLNEFEKQFKIKKSYDKILSYIPYEKNKKNNGNIENYSYESDDEGCFHNKQSFKELKKRNKDNIFNEPTKRKLITTIFGITPNHEKIAIHILDYSTEIYIKIPSHIVRNNNEKIFTKKIIEEIKTTLKNKHYNHHISKKLRYRTQIIKKHEYINYKSEKSFIKLRFKNSNTRRIWVFFASGLLYNRKTKKFTHYFKQLERKKIHEENKGKYNIIKTYGNDEIEPYMFYKDSRERMKPSGWHKLNNFKNVPHEYKRTKSSYEVIVKYKNEIEYINDVKNDIPMISYFVFDIECYPRYTKNRMVNKRIKELKKQGKSLNYIKNNIKNIKLHPNKENNDPITNISICTAIFKDGIYGNYKHYMLSLGAFDDETPNKYIFDIDIIKDKQKKKKIDEIETEYELLLFKNEKELLIKFFDLLKYHSPMIISHYNGNYYDWEWIIHVAKREKIEDHLLNNFNMINKLTKIYYRKSFTYGSRKYSQHMHPKYYGCIDYDDYFYYKRTTDTKYPDNKLDTISGIKLKKNKIGLEYYDMYELIRKAMFMPKEAKISNKRKLKYIKRVSYYCIIDSIRVMQLLMVDNNIKTLFVNSIIDEISPYLLYHSTSTKKLLSLISKYCKKQNYIIRHKKLLEAEQKLMFWKEYENDSDVKNGYNKIQNPNNIKYETIRKNKYIKDTILGWKNKGGFVFNPIPGIYNWIVPIDFKSMYPNMIRSKNLSPELVVHNDKIDKYINDENRNKFKKLQWTRKDNKVMSLWIKKKGLNNDEGILSQLSTRFLEARQIYKNKLHKYKNKEYKKGRKMDDIINDVEYFINNTIQLAFKIKVNSIYGSCGTPSSPLYCIEVAGLTTEYSREMMAHIISIIEKFGGKVIYGDTDSELCDFSAVLKIGDGEDEQEFLNKLYELGNKVCEAINEDSIKRGLKNAKIEIDDGIYKRLILSDKKKKYSGVLVLDGDINKQKLKIMGHYFKKRDSSPLDKTIGNLVTTTALYKNIKDIPRIIDQLAVDIWDRKYNYKHFICGEKYKGHYGENSTARLAIIRNIIMKHDLNNLPSIDEKVNYIYKNYNIFLSKRSRGGIPSDIKVNNYIWPVKLISNTDSEESIDINYLKYYIKIVRGLGNILKHAYKTDNLIDIIFNNVIQYRPIKFFRYDNTEITNDNPFVIYTKSTDTLKKITYDDFLKKFIEKNLK
jgi:DNA polymerase elongation subunit (family B)